MESYLNKVDSETNFSLFVRLLPDGLTTKFNIS